MDSRELKSSTEEAPFAAASVALLRQKAHVALDEEDYEAAVQCFTQLAEQEPEVIEYRLLLGFAYLLGEQEAAAQLIWAAVFAELGESEAEFWLTQLAQQFEAKLEYLEQQENFQAVWFLCRHLHELLPLRSDIIMQGILAGIKAECLEIQQLASWDLLAALEHEQCQNHQTNILNSTQLQQVLESVIFWDRFGHLTVLAWVRQFIDFVPNRRRLALLLRDQAMRMAQQISQHSRYADAKAYLEVAQELDARNFIVKLAFADLEFLFARYREVIPIAQELLLTYEDVQEKLLAQRHLIRACLYIPEYWDEGAKQLQETINVLKQLTQSFDEESALELSEDIAVNQLFYLPYVQDSPHNHRKLQNQLSKIYWTYYKHLHLVQFQTDSKPLESLSFYSQFGQYPRQNRSKIRLGFISAYMARNSVGWLSRWVFQHYDPHHFEVYAYFQTNHSAPIGVSDFSRRWFARHAKKATETFGAPEHVAELIAQDEIDILIDLDSLTFAKTYSVLALKPAPIQVTWLGYDASGLPTIDYYLADPYVLPEEAENYYSEKIWRLPHTYIAVDGFEVGIPTLRREQLGIPLDAVVYFSAQGAFKRHPEITRCQIQILKQVPNSYLLIKGLGAATSLQTMMRQMAVAEGIDPTRLRFLPRDSDEPTHRANMSIADVVLDTFPYTGATTTLETLWMGIPLVTRVGQQFSSRNSYMMLRNVGVEAGIAHSAEEYITWGVRYGRDAALRQQVRQQLRMARQTSPLWNAQQFTRDLEAALAAMWDRSCQGAP